MSETSQKVQRVPQILHRDYHNLGAAGSRKAGRRVATSQPGHYSYPTGGGLGSVDSLGCWWIWRRFVSEITELSLAHGSSKSMDLRNSCFVCQVPNSSFAKCARFVLIATNSCSLLYGQNWYFPTIESQFAVGRRCPRLGCLVTSHRKYQQKSNTYDIFVVHILYRNKRRFWKHQSQIPLLWPHLTDSIQFLFSSSMLLPCKVS